MLLDSDGVTEGRCPAGTELWLERLTGFNIPAMTAREPTSEELCLLIQAILDRQENELVMTRRSCCWNAGRRDARRCPTRCSAMRHRRDGRVRR